MDPTKKNTVLKKIFCVYLPHLLLYYFIFNIFFFFTLPFLSDKIFIVAAIKYILLISVFSFVYVRIFKALLIFTIVDTMDKKELIILHLVVFFMLSPLMIIFLLWASLWGENLLPLFLFYTLAYFAPLIASSVLHNKKDLTYSSSTITDIDKS